MKEKPFFRFIVKNITMSKSKKNKSLKKENRKAISATLFANITSQLVELGFDTKKINKDVKKTADKLAQKISKFTMIINN